MNKEAILKGYDPAIMKRLWRYAKKHRLLIGAALASLLIGTVCELALPVVVQRTVDNILLPNFSRIDSILEPAETRVLTEFDGRILTNGAVFLNAKALTAIPIHTAEQLRARGAIDSTPWVRLYTADLGSERGQAWLATAGSYRNARVSFVAKATFDRLPEARRREFRATDIQSLLVSSGLFLGLLVVSVAFSFGELLTTALVGQRVMRDLRQDLFDKTIRQRQGFLQTNPVGKLVTRLVNDVETINELFTSVLNGFIKDFAIMIGVVIALFSLNARLAAITVATLAPVAVLVVIFRSQAREAYRRVRLAVSAMNGFLAEHFSGMSVIQLFVRQTQVHRRFLDHNGSLMRASLGEMRVFAIFRPLTDLLASISIGIIIYVGASQFLNGLLSLGILIAFINLINRFFEPVLDISDKFNLLQSAMAGGERAFGLLDEEHRLADTGTVTTEIRGAIRFEAVNFAYKPGEPVLQDLSFEVQAGEKLAVVGYTGAGKTTIANVLTRLWDIDQGRILVDGIAIDDIPLDHLRRSIQPLQQDVFLFTDTIRENILMGKQLPDSEIWALLEQVQAHDYVWNLPEKLDTLIAEGATNLSGGQRQLLSFARILAQDPRVIVMDEASANIDSETEQRIQAAMRLIMKGRTSIVIAHRLSTIEDAHRILVLGSGRVIESGTHHELLTKQGFYWNLYRLQFEHGG